MCILNVICLNQMSYSYTYNTLLPKAARRRMLPVTMASTLLDKLWALHCVADLGDGESLLNIDRVFLHERTGSIALQGLADAGRALRDPGRVFCTMDHIVDTYPGRGDETAMPSGRDFIVATRAAAPAITNIPE